MANKTSQHILSTSTNLLGFCLIVITSIHIANKAQNTIIDELTSIVAIFLTISSILSYVSIRANKIKLEEKLEQYADYLFLISLVGILAIILFVFIQFL